MPLSPLHRRLKAVIGERSFREVGELTNTNHETVRRYLQGQSPSVEFLSALCEALKVNGAWLLLGQGPMHAGDARGHALQEANPHELLAAVADTLERLHDRVSRIELFVQTIETRLRAAQQNQETLAESDESLARIDVKLVDSASRDGQQHPQLGSAGTQRIGPERARGGGLPAPNHGTTPTVGTAPTPSLTRARGIADAIGSSSITPPPDAQ